MEPDKVNWGQLLQVKVEHECRAFIDPFECHSILICRKWVFENYFSKLRFLWENGIHFSAIYKQQWSNFRNDRDLFLQNKYYHTPVKNFPTNVKLCIYMEAEFFYSKTPGGKIRRKLVRKEVPWGSTIEIICPQIGETSHLDESVKNLIESRFASPKNVCMSVSSEHGIIYHHHGEAITSFFMITSFPDEVSVHMSNHYSIFAAGFERDLLNPGKNITIYL